MWLTIEIFYWKFWVGGRDIGINGEAGFHEGSVVRYNNIYRDFGARRNLVGRPYVGNGEIVDRVPVHSYDYSLRVCNCNIIGNGKGYCEDNRLVTVRA